MIVVTNRICVSKGKGAEMAPRFTSSQALCEFAGFIKVEVIVVEQENQDEMSVNMYWRTMEDFQVWRASDAFKAAHKRPPKGENDPNAVIGSQLLFGQVAATLLNDAVS
ncbi:MULTISPECIES: heme oxygenase [Vitreoscilla]|uniref:Heme oxygenase n=1 Tax=Vitreoscilla stercoraria TaxID=61 RepID=A0ABY4EAP0_VITST|nr:MULTISPECIES: heme oxygenase [Vitreoscilla]AUZ05796.1 putative antibiotic biosynthesis monooxygenase [Vitreoscilla sp. C1]UOO92830.1 heme oxygenase [Vitreoscilla stercoraria]